MEKEPVASVNSNPTPVSRVSVHGGHSGEFCNHGSNQLEEIVRAYIEKRFEWVGITEHMPPVSRQFMLEDEIDAQLTPQLMYERFARYAETVRSLKMKYSKDIKILLGFEAEWYTGSERFVQDLRSKHNPDYIVGSIHHTKDLVIDGSPTQFAQVVAAAGGIEELYCAYFDEQYDLINKLKPEVVGHFDLIRLRDEDYRERMKNSEKIRNRIRRNLEKIGELGLILDLNLRAFKKGQNEPFPSEPILKMARELGIPCVPGDDSHGVAQVGMHLDRGIDILKGHGFSTDWPIPGRTGK